MTSSGLFFVMECLNFPDGGVLWRSIRENIAVDVQKNLSFVLGRRRAQSWIQQGGLGNKSVEVSNDLAGRLTPHAISVFRLA
ncbi:MAG: hypothetical protein ACLGGO_11665 [Coleofasciculus sp.]